MAKIDKTGDAAIMPLHRILMKMCGQTGYTPDAVFEGLLDYIIGYLNPSLTPEPIEGWKFKPQDTPTFHEMMQTVFRIYSEEIPRRRWYDPFGDLYMAIHAGGGGKGQFFTPPSVAQCVADVNIAGWDEPTGQPTPFGHRITIADCAAGSGRMPLAGYCSILHKMQHDWGYTPQQAEARRPYISCEDLDYKYGGARVLWRGYLPRFTLRARQGAAGLHRERKHVAVPNQRAKHPQGNGPDAVCCHSPMGYAWQCRPQDNRQRTRTESGKWRFRLHA